MGIINICRQNWLCNLQGQCKIKFSIPYSKIIKHSKIATIQPQMKYRTFLNMGLVKTAQVVFFKLALSEGRKEERREGNVLIYL
jgi:hypothetical protein